MKKSIVFVLLLFNVLLFSLPVEKMKRSFRSQMVSSFSVKEDPIGYLDIPKLEVHLPFYSYTSKENTVSKNIQWITSDLPNQKYGNFILAAHSGNTEISYFQDLNQLMIGDILFVSYDQITYSYEVIDSYETLKKEMKLKRPMEETTVTLVTCVSGTDRRFVVVGKQL